MTQVEAGELVEVTFRGRVVRVDRVGSEMAIVQYGLGARAAIDLTQPSVTVSNIASALWPPQDGDVWADGWGWEYFAVAVRGEEEWVVELVGAVPGGMVRHADPQEVSDSWGPLRLVRRRGWAPPGEPDPCEGWAPPDPASRMWTRVWAAVTGAGLPQPTSVELDRDLEIRFGVGATSAVDEWATYLEGAAAQLSPQDTSGPWHSYAATLRWYGWDVRVSCSVMGRQATPSVQGTDADAEATHGDTGGVDEVAGPALTDRDADTPTPPAERARHEDLATTLAYVAGNGRPAGRAEVPDWASPDVEVEDTGPVWGGPGPIGDAVGDHDA